jgi:hypothetical protein
MAALAKSDAPARDSSVTAETARFPQFIRAGFRPMLHTHEDFLAAAFAEKPVREFREILDKSLGAFVFSRNAEGELVVALVEERPTKGSPYWYSASEVCLVFCVDSTLVNWHRPFAPAVYLD